MDAFTLLKFWKPTNAAGPGGAAASHGDSPAVTVPLVTEEESNDDGPFFDLEFAVHDEDNENASFPGEESEDNDEVESDCTDEERVLDFKGDLDPNLSVSPSDALFFNGGLVPIGSCESNSKSQISKSLMKSKTRFRVFALGFKKSKPILTEKTEESKQSKFFTVKFKVEEVPIMSIFTKAGKRPSEKVVISEELTSGEKRFSKEVMHKYLNKVKPLYVRVSRKFGESPSTEVPAKESPVKSTDEVTETPVEIPKSQKQGNLPAGLRVVCKHLGKSRSASSAVAAAPAPSPGPVSSRRDDSLLQQQDGIQSAILHCKKSFNYSGDSESSLLARSVSDSE